MMQVQKVRNGYKLVKSLFGKYEEIPEEWEQTTIGEYTIILVGFPFPSEQYSENPEDIRLLRGDNITEGKIRWAGKTRFWKDSNNFKKYQLKEHDFVIGMDGSKVGKNFAYVTKNDLPSLLLQRVACLRSKDGLEQKFLGYLFGNKFQNYVNSIKTNAAIPHISTKDIQNFELFLPTKKEQQKIASILSNVDSLISQTQKEIEQTQRLKKGLMQKLLTKGIGHTKFKKVKSYFGKYEEIPDDWDLNPLGNLCEIRKKNNVQSNLYIGLEHIGQGTNSLTGQGDVEQFTSTKNVFRKGDVLYGKLRPLLNKVWLSTEDGFCSTDILPITTKERLDNRILEKILSSDDFVDYATSSSAGTKMPRTNWSDIQKYEIKLPPIPEQQKIASILSNVDSQIQKQQEYKSKLESLKKGLMQKLLTGQIRVKV